MAQEARMPGAPHRRHRSCSQPWPSPSVRSGSARLTRAEPPLSGVRIWVSSL